MYKLLPLSQKSGLQHALKTISYDCPYIIINVCVAEVVGCKNSHAPQYKYRPINVDNTSPSIEKMENSGRLKT